MKYDGKIILAAHRGDRKKCPENTMPAFESAINFGVDMIETDIHMTGDGELIIMHDLNTIRTTGNDGFINEMSFEEIKKLDAGSWFSKSFENVRVPSVKEFIELIENENILVNWELKDYPRDVGDEFSFRSADMLIEMIERNGLTERSMLNSFSNRVLEHIYINHKDKFALHGQGIYNCRKTCDKAEIPENVLYDWCCLYPNEPGKSALDFSENFDYCNKNGIFPCVCVADEFDVYRQYVELGCKMFTSNDIYEGDRILKELKVR